MPAMTTRRRSVLVPVLLVCLLLFLSACGDEPPTSPSGGNGPPAALIGTVWRVVSVGGRQPLGGREPTVAFDVARVTGSGGCNSFGGSYRYDPAAGAIAFDELGMTAMACVEQPINDFEGAFMQTITRSNRVSVDDRGLLVLSGPGGQIFLAAIARAVPQAATPRP